MLPGRAAPAAVTTSRARAAPAGLRHLTASCEQRAAPLEAGSARPGSYLGAQEFQKAPKSSLRKSGTPNKVWISYGNSPLNTPVRWHVWSHRLFPCANLTQKPSRLQTRQTQTVLDLKAGEMDKLIITLITAQAHTISPCF